MWAMDHQLQQAQQLTKSGQFYEHDQIVSKKNLGNDHNTILIFMAKKN